MSFSVFNCVSSNATGGLEQMFLDYSSVLNDRYNVLCIVSENFKYFDELETRGVPYKIIKVRNYYDLIAAYQFIQLYKKHLPRLVFSHNGRFNSVIKISAFFSKIENTIGVCHGDVKRLEHFSKVITVSMALKTQLLAKGLKNVFFLPNFIELKDTAKHNTKETPHQYTFGVMSRLAPEKSIEIAIKAIAKLSSQDNSEYRLIIAGTGPEQDMLVDLVDQEGLKNNVTFLGWIEDKDSFYKQIDCFLIPSQHEPFGITILEAFNYKLPVIAAKAEGPLEIIEDQDNGLLFDINNIEQLTTLMSKVSQDTALSKNIGNQGHSTLKKKYTTEVFSDNLYTLCEQT